MRGSEGPVGESVNGIVAKFGQVTSCEQDTCFGKLEFQASSPLMDGVFTDLL